MRKNIFKTSLAIAALFTLTGCGEPSVDPSLISLTPASAETMATAQKAAAICARHPQDTAATTQALRDNGFKNNPIQNAGSPKAARLEGPQGKVQVAIGARNKEHICLVGAYNMTPQQSYALAQPWVKKFNARTNKERGQGLAKNAVQAWGEFNDDSIVFIASYKTWDVLDAPGSAARLIYITR